MILENGVRGWTACLVFLFFLRGGGEGTGRAISAVELWCSVANEVALETLACWWLDYTI